MTDPLLLRGARLVGGDGRVRDVLVTDGLIASVGVDLRAKATAIDLDGRWLIPGLWDHHVHFTQWSRTSGRLDVSFAHSAVEVTALVGTAVREVPGARDTLVGFGFRPALWPDLPTVELLDAVAPDRPVVLISADLHAVWVNSAAVRAFDLPHGGLLRESDAFSVESRLAELSHDDSHALTSRAMAKAAARGVVGIVDLEMDDSIGAWRTRVADGLRGLRVRAGFYPEQRELVYREGLSTGDPLDDSGLLELGPLKLMTDGSLNTGSAYCHDPYPDTVDHGVQAMDPTEMESLMTQATEHGVELAVHAIGDLANSQALDAFQATGARGSIEHAQLLRVEDIARFAQLGVVASVQPEHLLDDRDVADQMWAGRTGRAYPLASLHAAGARITLGSDAPVSRLDPWLAMAAAVYRSRDERDPWHPEQHLTREQALAAAVPEGAAVAEGRVADLVAVELDPLTCTVAELRAMQVGLTLLAGSVTHQQL